MLMGLKLLHKYEQFLGKVETLADIFDALARLQNILGRFLDAVIQQFLGVFQLREVCLGFSKAGRGSIIIVFDILKHVVNGFCDCDWLAPSMVVSAMVAAFFLCSTAYLAKLIAAERSAFSEASVSR